MSTPEQKQLRPRKITVLAFGEGDDEKVFLRYIVANYCRRDKVAVASASAGGGGPTYILEKAMSFRRGEKRDFEFILLDTDKVWPEEMVELAREQGIELIGNTPCLESLLLEILNIPIPDNIGSGRCKQLFEEQCLSGNFNEEECQRLFPKPILNLARQRIQKLDTIIKKIEGELPQD